MFLFLLSLAKSNKNVDSKKVEYKERIGINIFTRETQTKQNVFDKSLMISAVSGDGEDWQIMWPLTMHKSVVSEPLPHSNIRAPHGMLPKYKCWVWDTKHSIVIYDFFLEYNSIKMRVEEKWVIKHNHPFLLCSPFHRRKNPHEMDSTENGYHGAGKLTEVYVDQRHWSTAD